MPEPLVFEGRCWKFGHNTSAAALAPPHTFQEGDIVVAGRNFGCPTGGTIEANSLRATGVGAIVAEGFSRIFYRDGHETGLPLLEVPGIHDLVETGDNVRVDIENGIVTNLSSGKSIKGAPPPALLLEMLRAGGLIPYLNAGGSEAP